MTETLQVTEAATSQGWIKPEPYYEQRPWFFDSWKKRHIRHKNVFICATGQSLGIGKSYMITSIFEETDPDFTVDQIVFGPEQFWYAVDMLPKNEWHPIQWDDPTRGLNKRDWFKEVNKTVTSFMKTSSRYKFKDIGFALPFFDDLDLAIREIMLLECQMKDPGLAKVHRIVKNRYGNPPFWKPYLGEVKRRQPKLAAAYEKRREEFHQTGYKKRQFDENPIEEKESAIEKEIERVLSLVRKEPLRFVNVDKKGHFDMNATKIMAFTKCTNERYAKQVRVIVQEELEKGILKLGNGADSAQLTGSEN